MEYGRKQGKLIIWKLMVRLLDEFSAGVKIVKL
jgi:hypothetical protein